MSGLGRRGRKRKSTIKKGTDGTSVANTKTPRVEDGEINTLGETGLSRRSTRITKSGEGNSGIIHS